MEQAGVQLIAAGANVYIGDLKSATNATNTFVDATEKGGGRVSKAGEIMTGALRHVGTIVVDVFGKALRATAAFVGDSIDLAGDFEQTMNVLQATSDATGQEMADVSAKAKALGADLSLPATSAIDAGKAMLELSKAGFTVAESMDAAKGVLQLAAAAQIDEAQAAEINANAINAFNLEAKDSVFISDLLAASANASSVEIKDVGQSYQMAGAIFANFQGPVVGSKQAIIDLTTAVGILGNAGIKGSDAGTSLKQALLQLTGPSDKAKGLMKGLAEGIGIAGDIAYTAQGQMRSFPEILRITAAATKDLTDEKRNQYITDIFGADASRAILVLMKQGPAAWAEMEKAVTKQGAAADLAAAKTKGYKGAVEGAKSQIETFQLSLSSGLMPVLADLINTYITPSISALNDFIAPIVGASDPMLAFASAIHQWSAPLGSIVFYLTELARGGEGVSAWLKETPALFQGLVGGVQGAVKEFSRLSEAFSTGGISGLIDTLITDIGAALPSIQAALLGWGEALIDWIEPYIPPMIAALGDAVAMAWGWIQDQVPVWIAELGAWGAALGEWVAPYIPVVIDALTDLAAEAWAWVVGEAPGWGRQLLAWGEELVNWIAPMIPPALAELGKLGMSFLGWIGDQAAPLLKSFLDWKDSFVAWIPGATVTFLAEWPKMFDDFLTWIGDQAGPLLKQLGDWALSFVGWIVPMIPDFLVTLGGVALALGVFVIETAAVLSKKITEKWIPALLEWVVTEAAPKLYVALNDFLQVFQDWIESAQRDLAIWMRAVGKSAVEGIEAGLKGAWSSLVGWLSDQMSGLVDAALDAIGASSPAVAFMPVGQFSVQGIMAGFESMWPELTAMLSGLGDDLADQAQDIADSVQDAIADAFGATASIDRQKVANLRDVGKLDEKRRAGVQSQINEAEKIAQAMDDPVEAANYFKMRSKQLIELGELGDKINNETDRTKRAQLQAEYDLINAAQQAEMKQFEAQQAATKNTTESLAQQINDLIGAFAGLKLTDNQIHALDALSGILASLGNIPHRAGGGPVDAFQPHWVGEKGPEIFWPTMNGRISPAATSQQMAGRATSNSYSNSKTINMPIYTNQSPAVLQQSWAIMQASMT